MGFLGARRPYKYKYTKMVFKVNGPLVASNKGYRNLSGR